MTSMTRKTIALVLSSFLFCFVSAVRAHSPHDNIQNVAVSPDFANDQTVFCSLTHLNYYILKSTDGGITWHPSMMGFPHQTVTALVLSPAFSQDGIGFVGTYDGEIYKSSAGGSVWSAVNAGLPGSKIAALAISPTFAADNTIFAGTSADGVYSSNDGGSSWFPANSGLSNPHIVSLALSPEFASDQTVFAGTLDGVFKSQDEGVTWTELALPPLSGDNFPTTGISFSPSFAQDQTVFASVWGKGMCKSTDGGTSWTFHNDGLTELFVRTVEVSPDYANDLTVWAATKEDGVFRSVDGGQNWSPLNEGIDEKAKQASIHYFDLAFAPNDPTVLFLAAWEGAHRLIDNGTRWRHLNVFNQNLVRAIGISPGYATDGTVFAGCYGGGVYRSEDFGATWQSVCTGTINSFPSALVLSPAFPADATLFQGGTPDPMKSTDGGAGWQRLWASSGGDEIYARAMVLSPDFANDQTLFFGNGSEGTFPLYKSTDGGESFTPIVLNIGSIESLAISPGFASDQIMFAGTTNGVYRSLNGGMNWVKVSPALTTVFALAVSPSFPSDPVVFAGTTDKGLIKSANGGGDWTVSLPASAGMVEALAISPEYTVDQTIFAATSANGIYKSTDGGDTWTLSGMEGQFILSLQAAPDFAASATVYAGAWDGVWMSSDGGASWNRVLNIHRWDDQSEFISYEGTWSEYWDVSSNGNTMMYSRLAANRATMLFVGDSITWIGATSPRCGIANVYVDDVFQAEVDLYTPHLAYQQVLFTMTGLTPGVEHSIIVEVTGTSNPLSKGAVVDIDAFIHGY